jgi:exonuclease SbcC
MADDADVCPVCERDYSQVSTVHLSAHIDQRLAELTRQGQRLLSLRAQREAATTQQVDDEIALKQLRREVFAPERRQQLEDRRRSLDRLRQSLVAIRPVVQQGRDLRSASEDARDLVQRLEEAATEVVFIGDELTRLAADLMLSIDPAETIDAQWKALSAVATDRLAEMETKTRLVHGVRAAHDRFIELQRRVTHSTQTVAEAAQKKQLWEDRVAEARRRQAVARSVHSAAATARTEVVQHVFTDSLNQVWRSVFSRLAPREQYIPSFGVPNTTKTALELTLQTTHVSGETGGSPQMMLSAGNLNTAALSLFLALHLAVEPTVPCLVFDDPVQAMDEVHISQFAGLIRMLSKHHKRQVVIAVHERELFEYLSLELSPAYEGDELLTIELGVDGTNQSERVLRHRWQPDIAIAV